MVSTIRMGQQRWISGTFLICRLFGGVFCKPKSHSQMMLHSVFLVFLS